MAAPRDNDLAVHVTLRHTIAYAGVVVALAGTAIGFDRLPYVGVAAAVTGMFGILETDAAPGQNVTIAVFGICQMISGGAVAVGARIGTDATSRATVVPLNTYAHGRALTAATAAGQKIQVLITHEGLY